MVGADAVGNKSFDKGIARLAGFPVNVMSDISNIYIRG